MTKKGNRAQSQTAAELLRRVWPALVIVSLCGSIFAGWTAYNDDTRLFGLGVWLLSLALLVAAGFMHNRWSSPNGNAFQPTTPTKRWTRADWIGVAVLTLVAFGLRLYRLDNTLPPFHGDEGEMGLLAFLAWYGPTDRPPLPPFVHPAGLTQQPGGLQRRLDLFRVLEASDR